MCHARRALLVLALALALGAPLPAGAEPPAQERADEPAPPSEQLRLLVAEANGPEGMDPGALATLSRLIESEVRRAAPGLHVVTMRAVRASLEVAATRDCLGAEDASCLSELAGAFGVDYVVSAHFGRVGSQGLLTLSVFRASDAAVIGQSSRRIPVDDDAALLDAVPLLVHEVLTPTQAELSPPADEARPVAPPTADPPGSLLPPTLMVTGVAAGGLLVVGGAVTHGVAYFGSQLPYEDGRMSRDDARQWEKNAPLVLAAPVAAYVVGAALIAGGVAAGVWLE